MINYDKLRHHLKYGYVFVYIWDESNKIKDESHPKLHMQARSKEGLSLFGSLS